MRVSSVGWIADSEDEVKYFSKLVTEAIVCFLEATSTEDAIRNAISLGGDADTQAAITGSMAEAYFGVPFEPEDKTLTYLTDELRSIYYSFDLIKKPQACRSL